MNQLLTQSLGHFPFLGQAGRWGWQKEEGGGQGWDRHLWDSLAPSTHPSMSTEPEGCAPSLGGSEEGLGLEFLGEGGEHQRSLPDFAPWGLRLRCVTAL